MKCSWPSGFMVLLLIGCGNDLAAPQLSLDQGEETNVWQAAKLGQVEPLKAALAKGIDLNVLNQDGWAPLHLAVVGNQVAAVEWLLKNGVRINAETAGSRSAKGVSRSKPRAVPAFSSSSAKSGSWMGPHTSMAPARTLRWRFGTTSSRSMPSPRPRPSQIGHMPSW